MNAIFFLLIVYLESIFSSLLAILPFQINQINYKNKYYNSTELINVLFETELYSPIMLGSDKQETFGILSLDGQHPILSDLNCEKMKKFEKNKNIVKKGYIISNSKSSVLLGNGTSYFNRFKEVQVYSELFTFYNTSIEEKKDKSFEKSNITLVRDSFNKPIDKEMCLSLGLGQWQKAYLNPEPPHFIDDLREKRKISRRYWTLKFTDQNEGYLIIGDKPEEYENDTVKYYGGNYSVDNGLYHSNNINSFSNKNKIDLDYKKEYKILDYINKARNNPKIFYHNYFSNIFDDINLEFKEFIYKNKKSKELKINKELNNIARKHCEDLCENETAGDIGTDDFDIIDRIKNFSLCI